MYVPAPPVGTVLRLNGVPVVPVGGAVIDTDKDGFVTVTGDDDPESGALDDAGGGVNVDAESVLDGDFVPTVLIVDTL